MWNHGHAPAAAGAGSSAASQNRPISMSNISSTQRRAGGMVQAQHGPSSSNAAFPRPNIAFPGTVSTPRSSAAPNAASSTTPRSIQHLSLLTASTPASIAKLAFPSLATVHWHRLQQRHSETRTQKDRDGQVREASSLDAGPSTTHIDDLHKWRSGVQHVIAFANKSCLQSQAGSKNELKPLFAGPLMHMGSTLPSQHEPGPSNPSSVSADLWIFVVVADHESSTTKPSAPATEDVTMLDAAKKNSADAKQSEIPVGGNTQQDTLNASTASLDAILAHHLPADLAKALARLSAVANVRSGSYRLAAAALDPEDVKGKQSSLTSEQRQAHRCFLAAIKARAIHLMTTTRSSSFQQPHGSEVCDRGRLRLGESVVFLPISRPGSDATGYDGTGHKKTPFASANEAASLVTQLDVSLTESSLLVRATSRRIAALPLASIHHAKIASLLPSSPQRPSMLIAPLGLRVELLGTVPSSTFAHDHLSELRTMFAKLHTAAPNAGSDDDALLASGLAVCALPQEHSTTQSPSQDLKQSQDVLSGMFPHSEAQVDTQTRSDADAAHGQPRLRSNSRQFLWPVAWCLVLPGPSLAMPRALASANSINSDLDTIQSQPMTPLKELAAFTLKVLNDANESTSVPQPPPYTPGETDDASLARRRADRLPSTRPDITPASVVLPDFDFAMTAPESGPSSHPPIAVGPPLSSGSLPKQERIGTESGRPAASSETFGQDLNWMHFLPAQSGEATGPASSMITAGAGAPVRSPASGTGEAKQLLNEQNGSNWLFATSSASSAPLQVGATSQSLLQPQAQMPSLGSTPQQGSETTPLSGLAQSMTVKRKAGEGDIFGSMGLLTEDDFSFFDESAFGLDPGGALEQTLDPPPETSSQALNFGQQGVSQPVTNGPNALMSSAAIIDDVTMQDIDQSGLDDLFSAIPGLQDVIDTSHSSQAQSAPQTSFATSMAGAQAPGSQMGHRTAQDGATMVTASSQPFHPSLNAFTPRDAAGATPFGDPASLPGFTPSSLTESSPAFGNPQYKTPRTPYSPVEEYHDGAAIVDLQTRHRVGDSAQSYRERGLASAQDSHASGGHSVQDEKAASVLNEDQLRLADASTAAAAAANAAMDADGSSRKRPAIVPNAFLPLTQPEARKPLQRLPAGVRVNLGRKYDLLGKFASRPKMSTSVPASSTAKNAPTTEPPPTSEARISADRTMIRPPSPKALSRRGQSLLQLRRDRHSKASPGSSMLQRPSSSSRMVEPPATPRSSDDFAMPGALSDSENETSSSNDDDSDDARSDTEGTTTTLSPDEQATMKAFTSDIVASYLSGTTAPARAHFLGGRPEPDGEMSQIAKPPALLPFSFSQSMSALSRTTAVAKTIRPTLKRSMLRRTANWLIRNPQFRSMYSVGNASTRACSDIAISEKVEVLEAMASALSIAPAAAAPVQAAEDILLSLPTLGSLAQPRQDAALTAGERVEVAEVLDPTRIAVGCHGSVVETLPSALTLWDKSKLSAVSGEKHVIAKVLLTDASPAWHDEIVAWLERLRVAFEAHGLGTHSGGPQSILAVADGSDSLALSSYLDELYKDGETWLDTLRSISSRVQLDLLQGKHVVVYTLQPLHSSPCGATGYHGLLRLEADLRAMLSEQVGVLAEQLLVRPVTPSMMTESGSLGFHQQSHAVRRLAFSVYDQLPRLVRRQPAKVLHGRELGPISAVVQFPAFSLSSTADKPSSASAAGPAGKTKFSLSWPQDPAAAVDENVTLHISYRICRAGRREQDLQAHDGDMEDSTLYDASNLSILDKMADAAQSPSTTGASIVVLSAVDERGGSSAVDAFSVPEGSSNVEACIERVWRFAVAEASRARLNWRLAISSAGSMRRRELRAWQRLIDAYLTASGAQERVMGSVVLLSVRPDDSGAILTERGVRIKASQDWATSTTAAASDKASLILLDAADFSQMVKFAEPMPMGWTEAFGSSHSSKEEEGAGTELDMMAMPIASAMLVHRPRQDFVSSGNNVGLDGRLGASHVLAIDMLQSWNLSPSQQTRPLSEEAATREQSRKEVEDMDSILRSLHRLRLISEERHHLPWPYNAQPWPVASVNTLASCLDGVMLID
ncbi:Mediator complex, subunit Med13 [Kalmanozyma brasiliensis GHG001]|uniref:Mediator complex, subunit Med13 n=1 Tax=Kalmanozyma brasiliensis (strain GHG001) TaxID=1365824 RepID=UPI001CE75E60|nr:Mediator complex, subunit Med13 [Kalmanozyma brasiliensis GHG001]EST06842.2 Mediator complex, subunit Med13 [Kalmanozyma brasiliensis GHG001]